MVGVLEFRISPSLASGYNILFNAIFHLATTVYKIFEMGHWCGVATKYINLLLKGKEET